MKKISFLLMVITILLAMSSCSKEQKELNCDGEGCKNKVIVKYEKGKEPDENWVVFCKTCAGEIKE